MTWKRLLPVGFLLAGGVGGFLYWKFIGCFNGTCMIASNMWISTAYGALLGYLFGGLFTGKRSSGQANVQHPD